MPIKKKSVRAYARKKNYFPGLAQISQKRRNSIPGGMQEREFRVNEIALKPAHAVAELASAPVSTRKLADHHGARAVEGAPLIRAPDTG